MSESQVDKDNFTSASTDTFDVLIRMVVFFVVLVLPFLSPQDQYRKGLDAEIRATGEVIPANNMKYIKSWALASYKTVYVKTGASGVVFDVLTNRKPIDAFEGTWKEVSDSTFERIKLNLPLLVYQLALRLCTFVYWLLLFSPFMIGMIYDGIQRWKSQKASISTPDIQRYFIYRHAHTFFWLMFFAYTFIPSTWGVIAQIIAPISISMFCILIRSMIHHHHKMV